ncbi:sigma-54-dependent transcriptional regulator [Pontiella sulfatireligans]|uniref:Transcriptional regulatory protein ZraR n=1 Tax=Pontiella sulfatireligans TaxID=2750658 RepID=A0A6C2UQP0_9BACT|nr:sigma-54 dependent transcriptional regulator [Pontiella sulfatireligans]VGO22612.1 Transcriptional regulatory protein ZraR [Pontiella sulfatireligans]
MNKENETSLAGLSVLVVEDETLLRRRLAAHLKALGAETGQAETLEAARYKLDENEYDFLLLDVNLPDGIGLDLMRDGAVPASTGVVVMTALGGVDGAVEAMRLGALDYLVKPFDPALLPLVMRRARQVRQTSRASEHEREKEEQSGFFFGSSLAPLRGQLEKILAADIRLQQHLSPVLITGETGTGKSTLARWLHNNGPRAALPLIEVNCSALPETLAESELFGSERGAFTDARTTRQGLFEAAHGGTLFLDELPSLSSAVQAKVLMAIEDRNIRRIGGTRQIEVDVRVIAATNRDMHGAVESGEFREDLLHRLDLFRLNLPALHERGEDLLVLAERLLAQLCLRHRFPLRQITEDGKRRMLAYRWPGNVRELAHELERGLVFEDTAALDFAHLPGEGVDSRTAADPGDWLNTGYDFSAEGFVLEDAINRLVQLALKQAGGNVSQAARMLGVTRDFIRYRLHGDRKGNL